MNFKNWLLNELTTIDPKITDRLKDLDAEELLYLPTILINPIAFIYSRENDNLLIQHGVAYHNALLTRTEQRDREAFNAAFSVRRDVQGKFGAVGRIAYSNGHLLPDSEAVVAFYLMSNFTHKDAKRSIELLLKKNFITLTSFIVTTQRKVVVVKDYLGIVSGDLSDEEKAKIPAKMTYQQRQDLFKMMGMPEKRGSVKSGWQTEMEKIGAIQPGQNWRSFTSESKQ